MFSLPVDVISGGVLPHLSVCDLQELDTAFTNKYLRPQLRQVWKSYQYDSLDVKLVEYEVSWLCNVGVKIKSFSIERLIRQSLLYNIPTLKKLHITSTSNTLFFKLAVSCLNLEELYVSDVYGSNIDNAVSFLAQTCRQLHTLHIESQILSDELTDFAITAVTQHWKQLSVFRICRSKITDAGIQALCDNCPHLKHIELSECYDLTDASLIAIANTYPQLLHISIICISDDGLIYFADKCHELRSVSFWSDNITSRGLTALWAANPNLMDVDISNNKDVISDDDIIQLVQCCPLLQKLNKSNCRRITDAAVIAVAEHCPQLRSLDISRCYDISNSCLIALGQHCHELKSIDMSNVNNISDKGIAALAAGCPLLQEFYARCTNITDAGVVSLARGCCDLRKIDLYFCKRIGITAISSIAQKCQLVSELVISYCMIDDACLYFIAQHCSNLTVLEVVHTKVSAAAAIVSVIRSCRFLRELRCNKCLMNDQNAKYELRKLASRLHDFEV